MSKNAHFKVDPRLVSLLGEGYRSSEDALKELVDNAWDADAGMVRVSLPKELTADPIVVEDDGTGMTETEIRHEYLSVANDRRSRKGNKTPGKQRPVKGRKGIGKFAGLMAADTMELETRTRGTLTRLRITKADVIEASSAARDLETIPLSITTDKCDAREHGTKITLRNLNQKLAFPTPERIREILMREYGSQDTFKLTVNGELIAIEDLGGTTICADEDIDGVGLVRLKFNISDGKRPTKRSGIVFRVGGKIVGRPSMLGLEDDEELPPKLLKRVYGEIEADGLDEQVTLTWGTFVENSIGFRRVQAWAALHVKTHLETTCTQEVNLAKARLKQATDRRLASLPEHRRRFATEATERIFRKFYGDTPDRIEAVISVALDAFEADEYWAVLHSINEATRADVAKLAEVLGELGIVDVAIVAQQTSKRLAMLDNLDRLITSPATLEAQLHKAIENNLWVLGLDFALMSSNQTLANVIRGYAQKQFVGARANKRPDLFLVQNLRRCHVLVEFKRPSHKVTRDDESQAAKYRDDLLPYGFSEIEVIVIGGSCDTAASHLYPTKGLKTTTYFNLIAAAREQLRWLLTQLGAPC